MVEAGNDPLQEQLRLAQQFEQNNNWELAYRNYHELAKRCMSLMANCTDATRKQALRQMADTAVTQAQWSKQMIED